MTLIVRELLEDALKRGMPLSSVANRGTGKTTASQLSALASAIQNPGTPVVVHDPDIKGSLAYSQRVRMAEAYVATLMQRVEALGLKGIKVLIANDAVITVRSDYAEAI